MTRQGRPTHIAIFGEVLFDCFPGGDRVLGGAPFNVAWHLQGLGDQPRFISRIGDDEPGQLILARMREHGMDTRNVQVDPSRATGQVRVTFAGHEAQYEIRGDSAYDYIDAGKVDGLEGGMLYHGTLGLRHAASHRAFDELLRRHRDLSLFIDVNLRAPWWNADTVLQMLERARWCKLNHHELKALGFQAASPEQAMRDCQAAHGFEQLILTRGEDGVMVLDGDNLHVHPAEPPARLEDTVGAGDAFSAVYIHGLLAGWSTQQTLRRAQRFAGRVIGLRGATPERPDFYQHAFTQRAG